MAYKKVATKKSTAKRGEDGYHERSVDAAHKASAIFETAEEFEELANAYFDECDACGMLYDEAGLCLYLSAHNRKRRNVTESSLKGWWDGNNCSYLQESVQMAYLRMEHQLFTDPRYMDKAMVSRQIFMSKQKRFGGRQDKVETKNESTIRIVHDESVSMEDFK